MPQGFRVDGARGKLSQALLALSPLLDQRGSLGLAFCSDIKVANPVDEQSVFLDQESWESLRSCAPSLFCVSFQGHPMRLKASGHDTLK